MTMSPQPTDTSLSPVPPDGIEAADVMRPGHEHQLEVRRALPAHERQMVGPFIFFDQMGPGECLAGRGLDVRPHPHIGLSTVTYLFDGEILHRDNLGSAQPIRPGDVNWMTAGRGHRLAKTARVREPPAPGPVQSRQRPDCPDAPVKSLGQGCTAECTS
jgi:Pirin